MYTRIRVIYHLKTHGLFFKKNEKVIEYYHHFVNHKIVSRKIRSNGPCPIINLNMYLLNFFSALFLQHNFSISIHIYQCAISDCCHTMNLVMCEVCLNVREKRGKSNGEIVTVFIAFHASNNYVASVPNGLLIVCDNVAKNPKRKNDKT